MSVCLSVGLLVAVTIGLLLGVVLGVILLAFVISCHKRYSVLLKIPTKNTISLKKYHLTFLYEILCDYCQSLRQCCVLPEFLLISVITETTEINVHFCKSPASSNA